jgi:hypothetical protein
MSDSELLKYGQSAAWMAGHNDRATWRVQLEEARAERHPATACIVFLDFDLHVAVAFWMEIRRNSVRICSPQ